MSAPGPLEGRRFKPLVAGLVAATAFLGAVGGWRATVAGGEARAAERKAIADQRAAAQQETLIRVPLQVAEFDYMRMTSLQAAAAELRAQAATVGAEDGERLVAIASAFEAAAAALRNSNPDVLLPDGTLDLESAFDVAWSVAAAQQDLDPGPEFAIADRERVKSERIVGATTLLVAAALFFTLASVNRSERGRRIYFSGGLVTATVATVMLAVLELR